MEADLLDSVVIVRGSSPNRFGTGFVFLREGDVSYVLTCRHVVDDVGGESALLVSNVSATLIAHDDADGFDLAVLRVDRPLLCPVLVLCTSSREEDEFTTVGFHALGKKT